jgi:hypothetical protein
MDPSAPVTGAVAAWMPLETPDVSPDSSEGWPVVAALATPVGSHRSTEIPPLAIANRTVQRVTRRVCCFDIDNPRSTDGRGRAYCTVTTVQQDRA